MRAMVIRRRATVEAFWPLWCLTAALQLLDVASVWLGSGVSNRIRETNPLLLDLAARDGLLVAMLVKGAAAGAGLALIAGIYVLALRLRSRVLAALCLLVIAAVAVYSATVFWNNVAALLGH